MGKEALLPGSIEPGKFYDFIGDKEAFNDLGLKEGEVNRKIDGSSKCCSNLLSFLFFLERFKQIVAQVVQLASWQPELHWKIQNSPGLVGEPAHLLCYDH